MIRFLRDRAGSVAIEYVLIGSLVALVLVASLTRIGTLVNGILVRTGNALAP